MAGVLPTINLLAPTGEHEGGLVALTTERMTRAVENLEAHVAVLLARLSDVMTPSASRGSVVRPVLVAGSILGQRLGDIVHRVEVINAVLADVLQELEL